MASYSGEDVPLPYFLLFVGFTVHHVDACRSSGANIFFFETLLDAAAQFAAYGVLRRPWQGFHQHEVIHLAARDALDAGDFWVRDHHVGEARIIPQFLAYFLQKHDHAVAAFVVSDGYVEGNLRPIASHVGDDLDFAVGDDVQGAVGIAQDGAAHGHVFDRALHAGDAHHVAEVVLVLQQNEEAVDHVFHQSLRAKPDGETGDSGRSQQRLHVDAEGGKHLHQREEKYDEEADAVDDAGQSAQLLRAHALRQFLRLAEAHQAVGGNAQQADQDEGNQQDERDAPRLVLQPLRVEELRGFKCGGILLQPGQREKINEHGSHNRAIIASTRAWAAQITQL